MADQMDKLLNELVTRLKEALADDLLSVVLYGSAASGERHARFSDLNVICVLPNVGAPELTKAAKTVQWWTLTHKQPPPLLMSSSEIECRNDVFPIEFLDIQQNRRVLYGSDPFANVHVDRAYHRAEVEHEISSNLLRLRQHYLLARANEQDVVKLMAESVGTFATLARHALILAGASAPARKRDAFEAAAAQFGMDASPFLTLLRVREATEPLTGARVHEVFSAYLNQIARLEEVLDKM